MLIGRLATPERVVVGPNAVMVIDLSGGFSEQRDENPLAPYLNDEPSETPGLYDVIRHIDNAAKDDNIKGIYLKTNGNGNGYASSEALRRAIAAFRKHKKFVYAYAEMMSQNAYYIASASDKVYIHPKGSMDFNGFSMTMMFLKGTLEKLEIQPQIFYNGRFKSATEPLRETKMTDANRIQTTAFLGELYGAFLSAVGQSRGIDTTTLHRYANEGLIQFPEDALQYKLIDGLRYDDQVMDEIKQRLNLGADEKVNFVMLHKYDRANRPNDNSGSIALIYAEGDIVSGSTDDPRTIASENYIRIIREARQDKDVKAIVLRVNSPGGSALASEGIWRELTLARKTKPLIVSMGNYAASGGYYISCMADTIYAESNTLTGSIGVFAILPNMEAFFRNKLGITFDGVKTAQYADLGSVNRPLTDVEKAFVQRAVDSIYATFKNRVVEGRKLSASVVDSISQGRVWTGAQAKALGLVDRVGGISDAIACAARMANVPDPKITAYPKPQDPLEKLMRGLGGEIRSNFIKEELGTEYQLFQTIKKIKKMMGEMQAKLPYDIVIQ